MPAGNRGRGGGQGGWGSPGGEMTFSIPAHKCGLVIGRGGENVKSINQQTGAFVEISRQPPPNGDPNFKLFIIRGSPQQIDHAKQLIEEKIEAPTILICSYTSESWHISLFFVIWCVIMSCVPGSSVSCGSGARWTRSCWSNGSLQPQPIQPRTAWGTRTTTVSSYNYWAAVCIALLEHLGRSCFSSCQGGDPERLLMINHFFSPQRRSSRSSPVHPSGLEQHLPAVAASGTPWPQWVTFWLHCLSWFSGIHFLVFAHFSMLTQNASTLLQDFHRRLYVLLYTLPVISDE